MSRISITSEALTAPHVQPHVIWRETDDGIVIVDPTAGKVRVLNPVGSEIWKMLHDHKSLDEMQTEVAAIYDVSAEQARDDIRRFLDDLETRGLIGRPA